AVAWRKNESFRDIVDDLVHESTWKTNVRALVAIYSSVILWIGGWNLMTNCYTYFPKTVSAYFAEGTIQNIAYSLIGLAIVWGSGTLYQNAGFLGSNRPSEFFSYGYEKFQQKEQQRRRVGKKQTPMPVGMARTMMSQQQQLQLQPQQQQQQQQPYEQGTGSEQAQEHQPVIESRIKHLTHKITSALPSNFRAHSYMPVQSSLETPRTIWNEEMSGQKNTHVAIKGNDQTRRRREEEEEEEKKEKEEQEEEEKEEEKEYDVNDNDIGNGHEYENGDNKNTGNSGEEGTVTEEDEREKEKAKSWSKRHHVRFWILTGTSLLGEFVLFIGMFNTCDILYRNTMEFIPFFVRTFLWLTISIGLMCNKYVNTFWAVSCVFPPWYQTRRCEYHDPWRKHFEMCLLSVISLFGMNMIAVVIQDNLQDSVADNVFKPLFLCTSGLLVYISTGSFIGNKAMFKVFSQSQENYDWKLQLLYFMRALLAFFAQVEHQLGAWEIFDSYIIQPTIARDVLFVLIGLIGLQWSKALLMNACVTPFNVPVQPDGLAAIYNMAEKTAHNTNLQAQTQRPRPRQRSEQMDNRDHVVDLHLGTCEEESNDDSHTIYDRHIPSDQHQSNITEKVTCSIAMPPTLNTTKLIKKKIKRSEEKKKTTKRIHFLFEMEEFFSYLFCHLNFKTKLFCYVIPFYFLAKNFQNVFVVSGASMRPIKKGEKRH
ncbi:hypothetical protein RFI_32728, partial [Reticulomyxa filosa]